MTEEAEYETAFIVARRFDGSFFVTDDLSVSMTVERTGTLHDIKAGCYELLERIRMMELTDSIILAISGPNEAETPKS